MLCSGRCFSKHRSIGPVWGRGTPLPPCPFTSSSFPPIYFSLSFIGFTYFLLLSIPSLSTRIVPLHFQARGRRRRPNLGLVCFFLCNLCYLYSLVKMHCGVLFYLVYRTFVFSFSALTLLVGKPVPDMTYNVFGGTLSLTQSINQPSSGHCSSKHLSIVRDAVCYSEC